MCACMLSHVQLFATPWTIAHWATVHGVAKVRYDLVTKPPYFVFYSLIREHSGCFQLLVIMNKATVNIHMQVFLCEYIFK